MAKDVFTSGDIRAMDAAEIARNDNEMMLIQKSGGCVAQTVLDAKPDGPILFFCGSGNNGADGLAAATALTKAGLDVWVYLIGTGLRPCTLVLWGEFIAVGGNRAFQITAEDELAAYQERMPSASIVVDAILGTGARFGLKSIYQQAADCINQLAETAHVIAVDMPTGVCADTGRADAHAVWADETVCLSGYKPGLILYPGADHAGRIMAVSYTHLDVYKRQSNDPVDMKETLQKQLSFVQKTDRKSVV